MAEKTSIDAKQGVSENSNHHSHECLSRSAQLFSRGTKTNVFPHPLRSLAVLMISVLVVESFTEIVIEVFFPISATTHVLLHSGMMVIILSPFFYYYFYRPYQRHNEYYRGTQSQIHYLSRQLINISENERKLLSQNLHDDFGQVLTAMQFGVETIKNSCLVGEVENTTCLTQSEKLSQLIADLGDYVRDVSTGLHPHMLDELGIESALKWYLDEFMGQCGGTDVQLRFSNIATRFPPEIELAIFRVCQESLNNIAKHAHAKKVSVTLAMKKETLDLCIEDDGVGFDLKELKAMGAKRSGIGLLGMRERVAALDGRLYLDSAPGEGTSVHAKIPTELRRRKNEAHTGTDR